MKRRKKLFENWVLKDRKEFPLCHPIRCCESSYTGFTANFSIWFLLWLMWLFDLSNKVMFNKSHTLLTFGQMLQLCHSIHVLDNLVSLWSLSSLSLTDLQESGSMKLKALLYHVLNYLFRVSFLLNTDSPSSIRWQLTGALQAWHTHIVVFGRWVTFELFFPIVYWNWTICLIVVPR